MPGEETGGLRVSVVFSPSAGVVDETELQMRAGATAAEALRDSGLQQRHAAIDLASLTIGTWGAVCRPDAVLRDRDRVEVYRPLVVDPKAARRRRQRTQQAAAAAKVKGR